MNNIVEFKRPSWEIRGEARCQACGHEWHHSRTVHSQEENTFIFDCPSCKQCKATMIYPYLPVDGQSRWACNCGCELFTLRESGAMCINCGSVSDYDEL